jgi:hypothetical protein
MKRFIGLTIFVFLFVLGGVNLHASDSKITISEFRQLYDGLLAGKTLVTTSEMDGMQITKTRSFGQPIDVGEGDFEVPIQVVVSKSKADKTVETINLSIVDRVNVLGDQPIISEETRRMSVTSDNTTRNTNEVESMGLFTVARNSKGGFDVSNFGLMPSVVVDGNKNKIAGSNLTYSCFPENNLTKCILTVRDYKLGPYTPLVGYTLSNPIGGDYVEISQEMKK